MKEKVLKALALNVKDLPRREQYTYILFVVLIFIASSCIVVFLGGRLSHEKFLIFVTTYCLLLLILAFFLRGKGK